MNSSVSLWQPSNVQALVRELAPDSQSLAIVKQTLGEDSLLVNKLNEALQALSITAERQIVDLSTPFRIQTVQKVLELAVYVRKSKEQQKRTDLVALEANDHAALSLERGQQDEALLAEQQKAQEAYTLQAMTSLATTKQATQGTVKGHIQMVQQHTEIVNRTLAKATEEKRALEEQNRALEQGLASLQGQ